ncbi:MAG: hypothetical protein FWH12_01395 [Treponema sp.]|nr:hypothetical protein [Treponema sp.]
MKLSAGTLLALLFFSVFSMQAQEAPAREEIFIAPYAETLFYSPEGLSYGGGLSLGYGSGTALGLRLLYAGDPEGHGALEILVFYRFYLGAQGVRSGPFIQLMGGPVLFVYESLATLREGVGTLSAGLLAGWRIPLQEAWYVEPSLRAGYPYIAGLSVSFGRRL